MKKDFLKFLYNESQEQAETDAIPDDISYIFEEMDKVADLAKNKKPLIHALKELGVEVDDLSLDPDGFVLHTEDPDAYRQVKEIVLKPENMHTLAELGWVAAGCSDKSMINEPACFTIRFLEIATAGSNDEKENFDLEKIIKTAQEWGDAHESPNEEERKKKVSESASELVKKMLECDSKKALYIQFSGENDAPDFAASKALSYSGKKDTRKARKDLVKKMSAKAPKTESMSENLEKIKNMAFKASAARAAGHTNEAVELDEEIDRLIYMAETDGHGDEAINIELDARERGRQSVQK